MTSADPIDPRQFIANVRASSSFAEWSRRGLEVSFEAAVIVLEQTLARAEAAEAESAERLEVLAKEITALREEAERAEAERVRLREALRPFAALYESSKSYGISRFPHGASWPANFEDIQDMLVVGHLRIAYAAMK